MPPILPIPELPREIRDAANRGKLAIFVGAGVSRIMGCQGWGDLAVALLSACFEHGYINFEEKQRLSNEPDHRKTLTICKELMSRPGRDENLFYEFLDKALQPNDERANKYPMYEELDGFGAVSVTTNADDLFDRLFEDSAIVYRPLNFPKAPDGPTKLYHLHGSRKDWDSVVFTLRDCIQLYKNQNIQSFLRDLFTNYTVLIVGYGLEEIQLLEYVITSLKEKDVIQHYMLFPMYSGDENILEFELTYYKELGIGVVPYDIKTDGYDQLYEVLRVWRQQINLLTSTRINARELIDQTVSSNYDQSRAEGIFQLIKNDKSLEDYFFQKVSGADWLNEIRARNYFDPALNPEPVEVPDNPGSFTVPHWNVLGYLEKVASESNKDDEEVLDALMEIVRSISDYRAGDGRRIQNYGTDWAITKILGKVPSASLEMKDFDRIAVFLDSDWRTDMTGPEIGISLLPKVLSYGNPEFAAKLFSVALGYKWETRSGSEEAAPLIDKFWLGQLLEKHLSSVSKIVPIEVAGHVIGTINEIIEHEEWSFTVIGISSIEDLPLDGHFRSYERFLARVLRDCLLSAAEIAVEQAKPIVSSLLESDHDFFRRVALHVIDKNWDKFNQEFWSKPKDELFDRETLGRELRELSSHNFDSFTSEQKTTWLDWIHQGPEIDPDDVFDIQEDRDRYMARWRLRWLSPLREFDNERIRLLLEESTQTLGVPLMDVDESDSAGFTLTHVVSGFPRIAEELSQMTTSEIVERLRETPESQQLMDQYDLNRGLQNTVESDPHRFANDLSKFAPLNGNYQLAVLTGLVNAWKEGRSFEWSPVFNYCIASLSGDEFWQGFADDVVKQQIVSQIADLITEGTRDDHHAYGDSHFAVTETLIHIMLERIPSRIEEFSDLDIAALNSPLGRAFTAAVNYSLRLARINNAGPESPRWIGAVREEFVRRLDRTSEPTVDFHYAVGKYLGQFYYLDRDWVVGNIEKILPKGEEEFWKAAFSGYLVSPHFYTEFYDLLNAESHYKKALETTLDERNKKERLVHHLGFAYLQGREQLDDPNGSFYKMVEPWESSTIQEIIRFFWMRQGEVGADEEERVLEFWNKLAGHYRQKQDLTPEDKGVLSNSSKLSVFLKEIGTEPLSWLILSAPYVDLGHDTPTLITHLDRLADTSPEEVAKVYIVMLEHNVFPNYEMAHVLSAVEKLYAAGYQDEANSICNLYLDRGFENLMDLFRKYNPDGR
ncbi:MAG: SIR2 family protein [Verrucomicrobia bacterium]|nr:SIR2 family protein [Verrucomicrobiota bacterium]